METLEFKEAASPREIAFHSIMLATDFSEVSRRALSYAAAIAVSYGGKLQLVHVVPPEPTWPIPIEPEPPELQGDWPNAEHALKAFADMVETVPREMLLERGPIPEVLADLVQRNKIDLLVLGTHGRGGLKKLILGSVAELLFRSVECPVLTVGPNVPAGENGFHRILFATDFGVASLHALPCAVSLAVKQKAELILLHVVTPVPAVDAGPYWYIGSDKIDREQEARRAAIERLKRLIPSDVKLPSDPKCIAPLEYGPGGILRIAHQCEADLIVMGVKRAASARTSAHLPWAAAHEVVCRAKCPVLTLRASFS